MPAASMTWEPLGQLTETTCKFHTKRRRRRRTTRVKLKPAREFEEESRSLVMIIAHVVLIVVVAISPLARPCQAQEAPVEPQSQALVYLLNELGSGDGPGGYARAPHTGGVFAGGSSSSSSAAPSQRADVSPSLIEARCWNNYENDDDCKQMRVITAPESERHRPPVGARGHSSDAIITPVVIFEASSTIEPDGEERGAGASDSQAADAKYQQHRPVVMAPPYFSSQAPPIAPASVTATGQPGSEVTRPSVVRFVATPRPKGAKPPKTTTQGRKCRDENDADCDEPEPIEGDNPKQTGASGDKSENGEPEADGGGGDEDDENGANDADQDEETSGDDRGAAAATGGGSQGQSNLIDELGSGGGHPNGGGGSANDDDDDDTDDDATDDDAGGEASGDSSNEIGEPTSTQRTRLVEVTSVYPITQVAGTGEPPTGSQVAGETASAPPTRRPGGNAQIDVIVHSTLPPNFPVRHNGYDSNDSLSSSSVQWQDTSASTTTTTTTTTMMPEEIYTSRPIFPSTTSTSQPATSSPDDQQQVTMPSTTENLYTFRPVPVPVAQPEVRPSASRLDLAGQSGAQTGPGEQPTARQQDSVSRQHIHEPPGRRPQVSFDDGWTTRRPLPSSLGQGPVNPPPDTLVLGGQGGGKRHPSRGHAGQMGTEMLPTLLLYASIIILLTTALIFLVMGYVFWRRNAIRRQAMLAKAHMMNNGALQQPPNMIESMSHASHLMHGGGGGGLGRPSAPYQQGLLSTYAPGKGLSMGNVTTSLVKPSDANAMMGQANEDDENGDGEQPQGSNSKDQLVADADSSIVDVDQQQQQQQQPVADRARNPRLAKGPGEPGQSGSWSTTDDQTNTTTSSGSSQQQAGDNAGAATNAGASNSMTGHPYPNSLSDGHQNSGSLSDSQCSPDPGPSSQPTQMPNGPPMMMMSNSPRHQVFYTPSQNGATNGHMRPAPQPIPYNTMTMQNGNHLKQRLVTSRSIEDHHQVAASHVGFVNEQQQQQQQQLEATNHLYDPRQQHQQHVPYTPVHHAQQPTYQPYQPVVHPSLMQNDNQMMIGAQRTVAMNPLATLGRRYPPGAGLNRNIYSGDSSSFMTTSPSLARTSSSSSFAFNMSNLPTPSSIKARPMIGGAGDQAVADYTAGFEQRPGDEAAIGQRGGAPPVFGRGDRSDAWYV